jgi:DNA-binding IclR family transcriptional regulator
MRVLEALSDLGKAMPLAAVVKRCGLSPSQTHRYLASLSESGMVKQNSNGSYDLGPAALKLGLSALARIDAYTIADEQISSFCGQTGATVLLAALGPAGPTIVRWHVGRPPVVTSLAVGSIMSLVHSATGQVFLAFRPDQEVEALVDEELARASSMDRGRVEAIRAQVREAGEATIGGTLIPGLNARAYPIFDMQGNAILVATLVTTSALEGQKGAVAESARQLRDVCRKISRILGSQRDTSVS